MIMALSSYRVADLSLKIYQTVINKIKEIIKLSKFTSFIETFARCKN